MRPVPSSLFLGSTGSGERLRVYGPGNGMLATRSICLNVKKKKKRVIARREDLPVVRLQQGNKNLKKWVRGEDSSLGRTQGRNLASHTIAVNN